MIEEVWCVIEVDYVWVVGKICVLCVYDYILVVLRFSWVVVGSVVNVFRVVGISINYII